MANSMSRYEPATPAARLPDLVDRLFRESFVLPSFDQSVGSVTRPTLPVNLFETGDSFVFHAALPGIKPENLDIQVVGRELTIKGVFESQTPENGNWIWQGIPAGKFYEVYTLPVEVDGNEVQASYDYGILSLVLPKAEHMRPRSIKVKMQK